MKRIGICSARVLLKSIASKVEYSSRSTPILLCDIAFPTVKIRDEVGIFLSFDKTFMMIAFGEVKPQSAIIPRKFAGRLSNPSDMTVVAQPIEIPSTKRGLPLPKSSFALNIQSRISNLSFKPNVMYSPSLSPCAL